jgi:hypothetical protein
MGCDRRAWRWLCLAGAAWIAVPTVLSAQQLTAGDTLQLRLLDRIHSRHRVGPEVRAVVLSPLAAATGRPILPPGSVLSGRVTGGGVERFNGTRHWLALTFDSVAVPIDDATSDTLRATVSLRLIAVDDARESVDSAGRIVGPAIPSLVRSKGSWALIALGVLHPIEALALAATFEGGRAERHRAIDLGEGTEMSAVLTGITRFPRWTAWRPPPPISSDANADSIVAAAPLRAALRARGAPSDIIAIAAIGSAAQMHAAFSAAGWTRAASPSLRGDFVTILKAARGEGYQAQPVSELVLGGRAPDEVYEQVADTFLKRHHFRVWRWPSGNAPSDGAALWLIAATHDTGLMYSTQRQSFTHTVDPRIDLERDKIVSDLVAADRVAAVSYVPRPAPANGATVNGGRAAAVTDWRMAVLVLK